MINPFSAASGNYWWQGKQSHPSILHELISKHMRVAFEQLRSSSSDYAYGTIELNRAIVVTSFARDFPTEILGMKVIECDLDNSSDAFYYIAIQDPNKAEMEWLKHHRVAVCNYTVDDLFEDSKK